MSGASAVAKLFKPRDTIYEEAYEGRQFDATYFAMMVFACLIALMGLLLNSPAVIIGAMLISPLMGPILACGLALTTAEWPLGKKASRNLLLSVGEVVLITMIATALSPLRELTPEILARTNPNLMDLLVAFFSGLAGTVALASNKTAFTILPGVAIATAVMPPLATVGYGISTRQWGIAGGAFMLFFTNFTAIVLSASLVFLLIGFRPRAQRLGESHQLLVRWRIAIAAAVVAVISIPLMRTLIRAAEQVNIRNQVEAVLRQNMPAHGDRQLDTVTVRLKKDAVSVDASLRTAQYIDPAEIAQMQSAIEKQLGRPVHLEVDQLQLARHTASTEQVIHDFLAAGLVRPAVAEKPPTPAAEIGNLEQRLEKSLNALMRTTGITLQITSVGHELDGGITVNLLAQAPQTGTVEMWNVAAAALANEITSPVKINAMVAGKTLDVHYRGTATRPSAAELRRIRQFTASLSRGVSVAFVPSGATPGENPSLAGRRIVYLHTLISRTVAEAKFPAPADANAIRILPVQIFQAESSAAQAPAGASPPVADQAETSREAAKP